jgi:hypothetical protein
MSSSVLEVVSSDSAVADEAESFLIIRSAFGSQDDEIENDVRLDIGVENLDVVRHCVFLF